jgi:hypothetical protein
MVDRESLWRRIPGALSQKTFDVQFLGPHRFQNVYPLNDFLSNEISDSQKEQGLVKIVGGGDS